MSLHAFPWLLVAGLLVWCLLMSGLSYLAFRADKRRSERGDWRIPESRLLWLSMLGGWPGARMAQQRLRHKTRKEPFRSQLLLTSLVLPAVLVLLIWGVLAPDSFPGLVVRELEGALRIMVLLGP